jgi:hypothetical protein
MRTVYVFKDGTKAIVTDNENDTGLYLVDIIKTEGAE